MTLNICKYVVIFVPKGGYMEEKLNIVYVPVNELKPATYNPRKWDAESCIKLKESLTKFGFVDPLIVNSAPSRANVVIGGHFRLKMGKELGFDTVPVVYVDIPDIEKEKELNLRLNRNTGAWDFKLLAEFDSSLLGEIGFSSEE